MSIFSTPPTSAPLTFSLVHLPSPPSLCEWVQGYAHCTVFIQCVTWGGGGDRVVCKAYTGGYTLCIYPDSEPTKLLYHPNKPRRGGGLRPQINTCCQVPLLVSF
jgi:hypothetical protein